MNTNASCSVCLLPLDYPWRSKHTVQWVKGSGMQISLPAHATIILWHLCAAVGDDVSCKLPVETSILSHTDTKHTELSMSLNCSNPLLRWGHTAQPITMQQESGTVPWANQHICAVFSIPHAVSSSFLLKYYFMWVMRYHQRQKWLACVGAWNHVLFFSSPLLCLFVSLCVPHS